MKYTTSAPRSSTYSAVVCSLFDLIQDSMLSMQASRHLLCIRVVYYWQLQFVPITFVQTKYLARHFFLLYWRAFSISSRPAFWSSCGITWKSWAELFDRSTESYNWWAKLFARGLRLNVHWQFFWSDRWSFAVVKSQQVFRYQAKLPKIHWHSFGKFLRHFRVSMMKLKADLYLG